MFDGGPEIAVNKYFAGREVGKEPVGLIYFVKSNFSAHDDVFSHKQVVQKGFKYRQFENLKRPLPVYLRL